MKEIPAAGAGADLSALVEEISAERGRRLITTSGGAGAVLMSREELEDLEDLAAVASYLLRKEAGTQVSVPHDEVVRSVRRRTA